jgi:hypothetical protein
LVAAGGTWYMHRQYLKRLQHEEKDEVYWTQGKVVIEVHTGTSCRRVRISHAFDHFRSDIENSLTRSEKFDSCSLLFSSLVYKVSSLNLVLETCYPNWVFL